MARIRYVKPSFFDHEGLATVSPYARLAFVGLWLQADRDGRLKDEPSRLRVRIFPYEPGVDMHALLSELAGIGVVVRYEVSGLKCVGIPGFSEHQRPHPKEPPSSLPPWQAVEKHGEPWKNTASTGCIPSSPGGMGTGMGMGIGTGTGTGARSALVVSPLDFARRQSRAAFVSDRFDVPHSLHRELTSAYGEGGHDALMAWYQTVADSIQPTEAIPDVFRWLRARFRDWLPSVRQTAAGPAPEDPVKAALRAYSAKTGAGASL